MRFCCSLLTWLGSGPTPFFFLKAPTVISLLLRFLLLWCFMAAGIHNVSLLPSTGCFSSLFTFYILALFFKKSVTHFHLHPPHSVLHGYLCHSLIPQSVCQNLPHSHHYRFCRLNVMENLTLPPNISLIVGHLLFLLLWGLSAAGMFHCCHLLVTLSFFHFYPVHQFCALKKVTHFLI